MLTDINTLEENEHFLSGYEFRNGKPQNLTIKELGTKEAVQKGGSKKNVIALYFKEYKKPMAINKTNRYKLIEIFKTTDYIKYINSKISVKFDTTVKFGKDIKGGLRILGKGLSDKNYCIECGEEVTTELAQRGLEVFGKVLCANCGTKAKEKAEAPTLENLIENMEEEEIE